MPVDLNKEQEEQTYREGNNDISATVRELETRIRWLEKGLKEIKDIAKDLGIQILAQSILDGEPTTADESNVVYISDVNRDIAKEWNEWKMNKEDE